MQRDTTALANQEYDLLIVGAGAFGAAAARDAALRGLRTALIDRADFGGATSAECFKMVHGGIRYLQHADLLRLRASCRERSALLRIAPHLVHPLPIAIPTYGHGRRGRPFLSAGACLYDLLTFDRNVGIADPGQQIRRTRFLSRAQLVQLFPHLRAPDLTGAVVFEDGQMHNPARLVLAFVKSAVAAGAAACNYVEALDFLWEGSAVRGMRVRDRIRGDEFEIRARLTLNAAGPWADYLQRDPQRFGASPRLPFSRDAYFIVDRAPSSVYGVAVQGLSRDKDAVLGRDTRHLFAAPWRDKTLFGVWHRLFPDAPDSARVEPGEVHHWIGELNSLYPSLDLSPSEVLFAHCGLVPFGETATATELSFGKQSRLIDHRETNGVSGLVSLVGIRFTTARADAARALNLLLRQSPQRIGPAATGHLPVAGGNIGNFDAFETEALRWRAPSVDVRSLQGLLRNHGTEYRDVLRASEAQPDGASVVPGTMTLLAEIWHAIDHEMAVKLEDIVLRRTDIAAGWHPGRSALEAAARAMGRKLDWSATRMQEETEATERLLARHLARHARHGAMLAPQMAASVETRPTTRQRSTRRA